MRSGKMNGGDGEHYCKGKTKSGKPCRAAATESGLCFFHANPDKASEFGRIGGRNNRHLPLANTAELPKLDTATDLRDLGARLILEVYARKLHPRIASGLAPLINLQLRAIEATDLERRLARVEKLLAVQDGKVSETDFDRSDARPEQTNGNGREDVQSGEPDDAII